jgi:hypothetical protein
MTYDWSKYEESKQNFKGSGVFIRKRKNLSKIVRVLEEGIRQGAIKPGDVLDTAVLARTVLASSVNNWFDRDGLRADEHGPTRSIGDLLGGHGLYLRKVGNRKYLMPEKLPIVEHDRLYAEAEY